MQHPPFRPWKRCPYPIRQVRNVLALSGTRTTANVCTPGTEIFMNGAIVKGHCFNSKSATYRGDVWVRVEVEVRGGEHLKHMIETDEDMEKTLVTASFADLERHAAALEQMRAALSS